jgi:type VI secretion system protein ImpA
MAIDPTLIEALLAPLSGDSPVGKNLRYDPRYADLREARREDDVLPEGGLATARKIADWPKAVSLATQLLREDSKDLQIAAWLSEALLRREGFAGFAMGLDVVRGIMETFWESCYPEWDEEDPELRAAPLEWIASKLDLPVRLVSIAPDGSTFLAYQASRAVPTEQEAESSHDKSEAREAAIADGKPAPEPIDRAIAAAPKAYYRAFVGDIDLAVAAINALATAADAKLGRDAPSFTKLAATIDEVRRFAAATLAQKLIDDPDPVADVGAYTPPAGATFGADATGGAQPAEPVNPTDAAARVAASARYLRKLDPTNPAPYAMLRGLRWGELRAGANGGANHDLDPRLLEAPPTPLRAKLKALLLDEQWSELLEQCETVLAAPYGRGWLDLQRYTIAACDHLAGYDAVGAAVRDELRTLLAVLPALPEMTLMDDTPTANDETRAWLAAEALTAADAPSDAGAAADVVLEDQTDSLAVGVAEEDATSEPGGLRAGTRRRAPINGQAANPARQDPFALARHELTQGRPHRAIELLTTALGAERSPRGRFVRQTQIAYVMVEAGLDATARPLLESLAQTIDDRHLEDWEAGPLIAQPLALLCRVVAKMDGTAVADPTNEVYRRVCRLDPVQAIALQRAAI